MVQRPLLIVATGLFLACVVLTLGASMWGSDVAMSVFWGCLVFALPTFYFALYAFRYSEGNQASLMARSFYWGQAGKLSLMAMGFAVVFVIAQPLTIPGVFAGFCLMIPAHLVVATFVGKSCDPSRFAGR